METKEARQREQAERQAHFESQAREHEQRTSMINQQLATRRKAPRNLPHEKVLAQIKELGAKYDQAGRRLEDIRFEEWELRGKIEDATGMEVLNKLAQKRAELEGRRVQAEGEAASILRQQEEMGILARDILFAHQWLLGDRDHLVTRLSTAMGEEKVHVEKELDRVMKRLKRFEDGSADPRFCLAVPMN